MDIRQLHYFLVLCEEMNYTRAAQRLFLSRQALRQSISALEAELCGPLFLSAHHKLSLTDRGVSLQRHAAPVVEQFQQMQAALHAEIQSAQPVRIGILIPYTAQVEHLYLAGFKYPLADYCLKGFCSIGVSNEITEEQAEITFENGILIVIESRDDAAMADES